MSGQPMYGGRGDEDGDCDGVETTVVLLFMGDGDGDDGEGDSFIAYR